MTNVALGMLSWKHMDGTYVKMPKKASSCVRRAGQKASDVTPWDWLSSLSNNITLRRQRKEEEGPRRNQEAGATEVTGIPGCWGTLDATIQRQPRFSQLWSSQAKALFPKFLWAPSHNSSTKAPVLGESFNLFPLKNFVRLLPATRF